MKCILWIFALMSSLICSAQNDVFVIENVNIFTGETYIENTSIIFNHTEIIEITTDVSKYRNATKIDGSNKTIIPPLVNAHVHMFMPAGSKTALKTGVFANLDMHNTDESANALRVYNDSLNYAKYYSSNAAATVPGGHGTQFGMGVPTINDSVNAAQFVKDRVAAHADYIKVIKEIMMNTLTDAQSQSAIDAAHAHNILAVGHSHKVNETRILTEQGIDGLMHIWYDVPMEEDILMQLKQAQVFVVPTLLVTQKVIEMGEEQGWAKYVMSFKEILEEVNKAHVEGIPILCGTDAPNFNLNYGDHIFDEMSLLSQAGLSNKEVLKSATTNVYNAFKLSGFSELNAGAKPNFILVDGNPYFTLDDIRNEKAIYKNGNIISN